MLTGAEPAHCFANSREPYVQQRHSDLSDPSGRCTKPARPGALGTIRNWLIVLSVFKLGHIGSPMCPRMAGAVGPWMQPVPSAGELSFG
jgi:hypothetical protein